MSTEEAVLVVKVKDFASKPLKAIEKAFGRQRDAQGKFVKGARIANKEFRRNAGSARGFADALLSGEKSAIAFSAAAIGATMAVAALSVAFSMTTDAVVSSIQSFAEFEAEMVRTSAVTSGAAGSLNLMRDAAVEAGLATTFSATDAAKAMGMLGMSGFTAAQQIASVKPVLDLANIGNLELARTAEITSNVLQSYGFAASELVGVNDRLAKTFTSSNTTLKTLGKSFEFVGPIAKATGQDFDGLLAQIGTLGNLGIQGSKAGTGLRAALASIAKPSTEGTAALKALNIQTKDGQGKMRQLTDIIAELAEKGATTSEILSIFGKVGGTAITALTSNVDGIRNLTAEIKASDGAAKAMAETINSSLSAQAKILSGTVETLGVRIGGGFKNALTDATRALTEQAAALAKDDELMGMVEATSKDLLMIFARILRHGADLVVTFGHIAGALLELDQRTASSVESMKSWMAAINPIFLAAKKFADFKKAQDEAAEAANKSIGPYARSVKMAEKLANSMRRAADATDPLKNGIRSMRREMSAFTKDALAQSNAMIKIAGVQLGTLWAKLTTVKDEYKFTAREVREYTQAQNTSTKASRKAAKAAREDASRLRTSLALKREDLRVLDARTDKARILAEQSREEVRIWNEKTTLQEKNLDLEKLRIETGRRLAALSEQEGEDVLKRAAQLEAEDARLLKSIAKLDAAREKARKKDADETQRTLDAQNAGILKAADSWMILEQSGSQAMSSLGAGLKSLTSIGADLNTVMTFAASNTAKAGKAGASALGTAGKSTALFAEALGASAAKQAGILGLFETAASVASFASGNIASGVQHGIAAATYGTVAAMGGGSAPASSGSSGGGGGASAGGGNGAGAESAQQRGAEILADTLADKLGAGGGQTILFDMRGANILDQEGLFNLVNDSARAQGVDLNDVGRN